MITEPLEQSERFPMVAQGRRRLVEVGVPVGDAVEALRDERVVADRACQGQRLAAILTGAWIVARRPEHPERVERLPRFGVAPLPARGIERGGELLVRAGQI